MTRSITNATREPVGKQAERERYSVVFFDATGKGYVWEDEPYRDSLFDRRTACREARKARKEASLTFRPARQRNGVVRVFRLVPTGVTVGSGLEAQTHKAEPGLYVVVYVDPDGDARVYNLGDVVHSETVFAGEKRAYEAALAAKAEMDAIFPPEQQKEKEPGGQVKVHRLEPTAFSL